jgi:hypothetical protein
MKSQYTIAFEMNQARCAEWDSIARELKVYNSSCHWFGWEDQECHSDTIPTKIAYASQRITITLGSNVISKESIISHK